MKRAIAIIGLLVAVSVQAQVRYDLWPYDTARPRFDTAPPAERRISAQDTGASYRLPISRRSALFGSVGLPGELAMGPPASYTRRFAGFDNTLSPLTNDQLDYQGAISQVFTVGYRWRNVQLEGSAFSPPPEDEKRAAMESLKLRSRSGRLSFNLARNLSFQLSRGTISNLDQFEPGGEVRRTTISATYKRALDAADWQTTLAWGRNARMYRESTYGYLLESSLRVANAHAFFGRMEQVGSDDLMRENESDRRQMFKMNKLTVGYVYDLPPGRYDGMDVGALMSRYYVPATMAATYGSSPVSYLMFVRFKLK